MIRDDGTEAARRGQGERGPSVPRSEPRPILGRLGLAGLEAEKRHNPDTPCLSYMPISWGGFGGQCRHIWHTWSVWVNTSTQTGFGGALESYARFGEPGRLRVGPQKARSVPVG